jgi:hypothetical protein
MRQTGGVMVKKLVRKPTPGHPLLEDVVKWIRNLEDGEYVKGRGSLVAEDGKAFCCLGVWADQHGCTWDYKGSKKAGFTILPIPKGKKVIEVGQGEGTLKSELAYGLTQDNQSNLASLNDNKETWFEVIAYIRKNILPEAI